MSALLIIESLDPKARSLPDDLAPFVQSSWNRGDPRRRAGVHDTSGHTLELSNADLDSTDKQISDAVAFLSKYGVPCSRHLQSLACPKAELILTTCISPRTAAAQEVTLPAELVVAAGSLGASVSLRTYLTNEDAA